MRLLTSFSISSIGIDAHQTGKGNRVKAVYMNSPLFFDFLSVEREIPLLTLLRENNLILRKNGEERKIASKFAKSK